jgi:IS605 OrfB family transposase
MLSYNTRLLGCQEDLLALHQILEYERLAFNEASKIQFEQPKNSIVVLHSKFYKKFRKNHPEITSQVVIRAEQECLSSYCSIKSNKHKISKPAVKQRLSMRLDKHLYCPGKIEKYSIRITTANKRKTFKFVLYPKLKNLLDKYPYCDPLIYEDDRGVLCISFSFEIKTEKAKPKLCLGVDLGVRVSAACSDGRLIIDKKFNREKRQLRYLKRQLQAKKTKSARKHLQKIRHKEANKNFNQTHLIANEILKTKADTVALENLKGIKAKKNRYQNKNVISQVPLFELRRVITYKADHMGKTVVLVNPYLTSQTDSLTGKVEGERKGRRFYAKSGMVYDADINAARNIGSRSKLPVSHGNLLDGQGIVTCPNVCQTSAKAKVLQAPEFIQGK